MAGEIEAIGEDVRRNNIGDRIYARGARFGADALPFGSASYFELVRALGADSVIDCDKEDLSRRAELFDIVCDAAGRISPAEGASVLERGGR